MDTGQDRRFVKAAGVALLATVLFAAWVGWGIGGDTVALHADDLGTLLAALTATVLCWHAGSRSAAGLRRFWWLLAAACGAWTLGELIWAVYELVLDQEVPVPSWADVGYLAAIPLAVAALLLHPALWGRGARRVRSLLDSLAVATALLFLSWSIVLGPLWRSSDLSTLGGVVALAYPFGDVVMIFVVMLAVRGIAKEDRLALSCLLGGLLVMALSDSSYAYLAEVANYEAGSVIDTGWFAAYLGIALGAYCAEGYVVHADADSSAPTLTSLVAPFLPMLAALTVAGVQIELGNEPDDVARFTALVLVVIVLVRQGLFFLDLFRQGEEPAVDSGDRLAHAIIVAAAPNENGAESSRQRAQERST